MEAQGALEATSTSDNPASTSEEKTEKTTVAVSPAISEDPDPEDLSMKSSSIVPCPVQEIAESNGGCMEVMQVRQVGGETRRSKAVRQQQQQQNCWCTFLKTRSAKSKVARKTKKMQMSCQIVSPDEVNHLGVSETQSDSAISQQEIRSGEKLFYGAHIGNETRNIEFKRGGGDYLRSLFRSHLRRYACAFLNSGGGSLLVGVNDNGIVQGIRCDHKQEDWTRLLVDSILKCFCPPLLPHSYSLNFLPVIRPGPEGVHLKVMRLTLQSPPALSQIFLYQTDQGEVFLRRDGSVEGPLNASAIQEWARQKWSGEVARLQQYVEDLLIQQRFLLQQIQHQNLIISFLHYINACLHKHSHQSQPPDISKWHKQTSGSAQTTMMPCNASGSHFAQTKPSSSLVPDFLPPQSAPEWDIVHSGPFHVDEPSLPRGHSFAPMQDKGPAAPHYQLKAQKANVPTSSICTVM